MRNDPSYTHDAWFFEPLNARKEKRHFECVEELEDDVMKHVTQSVVEEVRLGGIEMIDWLIDEVFGGEDEFKKAIAKRIKMDDPMYLELKDEYLQEVDPVVNPLD